MSASAEPLSGFTTLRVGGPAEHLVRARTEEELTDAALSAWSAEEPWLVLGGGSNLVIADEGVPGTVLKVETSGIRVDGDGPLLRVAAGENWDALVAHTVAHGWAGIEALSGIPGTAGAAPMQNIGAYGQELAETLVAIDFLDHETGQRERVPADELELGYRTSALKRGRRGVVLAIELRLTERPDGVAGYPQLAAALGVPLGSRVPLQRIRESVLALRAAKGMVLDEADPDTHSAGSFFTNPIVSAEFARSLPAGAPRWPVQPLPVQADLVLPLGSEVPLRPAHRPQQVKLSAAWLIEHAGISKGFSLPGSRAGISTKHSLAITNRGGATAAQVAELSRFVRARVSAATGVELQPEPVAAGVLL